MHFQEVWVKGSQIVASSDRQFDQFAREIQIASLGFKVSEATSETVKLTYSFGANVVVPRAALGALPIASLR